MASGTQVRRVLLQLSADDGDTEAKLDAIAAKADELAAKHPELKVRIETAAANAKLRVLRDELKAVADSAVGVEAATDGVRDKMLEAAAAIGITRDETGKLRNAAREVITASEAESLALKHLRDAALEAAWAERELDKYQKEQRKSLLSRAGSGIAGLPGQAFNAIPGGAVPAFLNPGVLAAAIPAAMALAVEVGSLATGLLAAGAGVAAFGAVAIPNLSAASTAAQKVQLAQDTYNVSIANGVKHATAYRAEQIAIGKAYAELSPQQITLSQTMGALQNQWQSFVQANTGAVSKVLTQAVGIVGQLLPWLQQFASAATPAIGQLLTGLSKFIESPNFQYFGTFLSSLSGPALKAIGSGMEGLTIRVMKLFEMFSQKDVINSINIAFRLLGAAIELVQGLIMEGMMGWDLLTQKVLPGARDAFDKTRHAIASFAHGVATDFDGIRHETAYWAHETAHYFDDVRHATADLAHNIAAHFDEIRHDIAHWVDDARHDVDLVVRFFEQLPGRVVHALAPLPGDLLRLGEQAITGLWNGLQSKVSGLLSTVAGWGHDIANALGSPFGVHFSEPSEATKMIKAGENIGAGLNIGIGRGLGGSSSAVSRLARLMDAHPGGGPGGVGGPTVTVRLDLSQVPAGMRTWLKKSIRITGGNVEVIGA